MEVKRARPAVVTADLAATAGLLDEDGLEPAALLRNLFRTAPQAPVGPVTRALDEHRAAVPPAFELKPLRPVGRNLVPAVLADRAQLVALQPVSDGRRADA